MSKADPKAKVIVIYKKKKGGHDGHHGGAWKVAYADFVTAMMCFFLLMWLISSTPVEKLAGIAEYFAPKKSRFKGDGLDSEGDQKGLAPKLSKSLQLMRSGTGDPLFNSEKSNLISSEEQQQFVNTMNDIRKDKVLQEFSENITWDITSEGLRIQVTDSNNRPMFKPNTADLAPYMKEILNAISRMISAYPNYIAISGHTASIMENDTSNSNTDFWQLSALRANEVRKFLLPYIKNGQVVRIIGKSDTEPMDARDPFNSKNARISITLLSNTAVSKFQLSVPEAENKKSNKD